MVTPASDYDMILFLDVRRMGEASIVERPSYFVSTSPSLKVEHIQI